MNSIVNSIKKMILFLFLMNLFCIPVFAEEPHPVEIGNVYGSGVDLKMHDHAVAGAIRHYVMWGYVDEASFSAEMMVRKEGELIHSIFKKQDDGKMGGIIQRQVHGKDIITTIYLSKVVPTENKIIYDLNGDELTVLLQPESVAHNHLINPTITLQYKGQEVTYKMQGEGCYAYLTFNSMMIAAAYFLL